MLGVVENMAGLTAPLASLTMRDEAGADATAAFLATVRERCPELLALRVVIDVFPQSGGGAEAMARSPSRTRRRGHGEQP